MSQLPLLLWCVVLALRRGHGRVLFHAQNRSIYCSATTRFLGPQYDSNATGVTAPIVVLGGDPCRLSSHGVRDKAVFLTEAGTCLDEVLYEQYQEAGARVVFHALDLWPGIGANFQWTARRRAPTRNTMLYVDVFRPDLGDGWVCPGDNVTVVLDPNRWIPMYASPTYQIGTRWLPASLFSIGAAISFCFFAEHVCDIRRRSGPGLRTLVRRFRASMTALLVEGGAAATMAVVCALNGVFAEARLPSSAARAFASSLQGFFFLATMISARIWSRILCEQNLTNRPGPQPCLWRTFYVMITAVPFLIDVTVQISMLFNAERYIPNVGQVNAGLFGIVQLVVGVYFMRNAVGLYRKLKALTDRLRIRDAGREAFLQRMSVNVGVFGALLLIKFTTFIGSAIFSWWVYPDKWKWSFSVLYACESAQNIVRPQILRARRPRPDRSAGTRKMMSLSTISWCTT